MMVEETVKVIDGEIRREWLEAVITVNLHRIGKTALAKRQLRNNLLSYAEKSEMLRRLIIRLIADT